MILFPAIDLKNGECVRLVRGDMAQARTHAQLGIETTKQLAESFPEGNPLRLKFESRTATIFAAIDASPTSAAGGTAGDLLDSTGGGQQ